MSPKRWSATLSAATMAAILTLGEGTAANAAVVSPPADDVSVSVAEIDSGQTHTRVETTMYVTGYDEDVAQANGYEIVTYDDGSWESVAVTEEAKAENAETGIMTPQPGDGSTAARGTVYGPCGSSFVDASASGRLVSAVTGYTVTGPVSNRIYWDVTFWTGYGATTLSWPSGPSPATWTGAGSVLYASSTGGTAIAGGAVILTTGTVCGAGLPSDGF
ncbi:hypothetical protein [Microbacterium rhizomatis]|uniref:Uncharacterized protein n=1 Tax=Microbacterium rhizomatis TaxID=1631477 RepID=A0A5J5IXS2_9MICO|nr:hypothetical protein [Microbacterium rhizomatis]KAA9104499.1 hypothetical protein F6B43_19205 [Microbacterium rhizomatis]